MLNTKHFHLQYEAHHLATWGRENWEGSGWGEGAEQY